MVIGEPCPDIDCVAFFFEAIKAVGAQKKGMRHARIAGITRYEVGEKRLRLLELRLLDGVLSRGEEGVGGGCLRVQEGAAGNGEEDI